MDHILRYHLIYESVVTTHKQSLWNLNHCSLFAVEIEISQQNWQISTFTKRRELRPWVLWELVFVPHVCWFRFV